MRGPQQTEDKAFSYLITIFIPESKKDSLGYESQKTLGKKYRPKLFSSSDFSKEEILKRIWRF